MPTLCSELPQIEIGRQMLGLSPSGLRRQTSETTKVLIDRKRNNFICHHRVGKCNHYMYRGEAVFFARFDGKMNKEKMRHYNS